MLQQYPIEMKNELSTLLLEFQVAIEHTTDDVELTTLVSNYLSAKNAIFVKYEI